MSNLFDVADVVNGDGEWSGLAYDVTYDHSAEQLIVQDICTRANVAQVAGGTNNAPSVLYTIRPFGAMVSAQRPNRCVNRDEFPEMDAYVDALKASLTFEAQRAASYVLYNGIPGWDSTAPFLLNTDVETVGSVANDTPATVAAVLDKFYAGEVGEQEPILHMGLTSAMHLSAGNAMSPTAPSLEFFLTVDGTPIVVSPAYPTNTVAATGGVKVHVGTPAALEPVYLYATNRTMFIANAALSVEFDASIAVRAT